MPQADVADRIDAAVAERSMLQHPFYLAWSSGALSVSAIQSYACQYYRHVEAFPMVVSSVHANCKDPSARRLLTENLAEEEGIGPGKSAHTKLWRDFAAGMGVTADELESGAVNEATMALISCFAAMSRRNYASGLGALYAYESQMPAVAKAKLDGLSRHYGINDEATLRFFRVHERADAQHAAACRDLLQTLKWREGEAERAATTLADALCEFLSGLRTAA